MRHLFSVLLFVATLIGTSSFMYETTSTTRAENISLQTQKKYKGRKACKRSKARKPSVHKKRSTRSVKVGRVVYITPTGSCYHLEKPLYFDPFGQIEFAPVGHNIIAPCKVLVQGSILFYPFRDSGFS